MHRIVKFLLLTLALFSCLFLIAHLITAFDHHARRDSQSSAMLLQAPARTQQQRVSTSTPLAATPEDVLSAPLASLEPASPPSAAAAKANATPAVVTPTLPPTPQAEQGGNDDASHPHPSTIAQATTAARSVDTADHRSATAAAVAAEAGTAAAAVTARPPAAVAETASTASPATVFAEHPAYAAQQQHQQPAHVDRTQPTHPHHAAAHHSAHAHDWPLLHDLHHDAQSPQYVTLDAMGSAASHHYAAFEPSLQQFAQTGMADAQAGYGHSAAACRADDFMCQLESMCQPCFSGLHTALCSPCAAILHCQHESCTHRATCQLCQHVTDDSRPPVCRQLC